MATYTGMLRDVIARWPAIHAAAKAKGYKHPQSVRPGMYSRVLGSSTKTVKGESLRVSTAVVYMSPASESGVNMCPWSVKECVASCIGAHTGLLALPASKVARLWKTCLYLGERDTFMALLAMEVHAHTASSLRAGFIPAVRLNGSSDITLPSSFVREHSTVRFYDYTKGYQRALASLGTGHHVTLSYTGHNEAECLSLLRAGGNVAVVFDSDARTHAPIPDTWHGFPVVDGDDSDARFLDPRGAVVGLRFKRASKRASKVKAAIKAGFVVPVSALLRKVA